MGAGGAHPLKLSAAQRLKFSTSLDEVQYVNASKVWFESFQPMKPSSLPWGATSVRTSEFLNLYDKV